MTPAQVRKLSSAVIQDWVDRREEHLLAQLSQQPPHGLTVTGLNTCLTAVNQHAVQLLVVPVGGLIPGFACTQCGTLASTPGECPDGPAAVRQVPDLLEEMAVKTLGDGGEVAAVPSPPGDIAARRRFPLTQPKRDDHPAISQPNAGGDRDDQRSAAGSGTGHGRARDQDRRGAGKARPGTPSVPGGVPQRVLRLWEMLIGAGGELKLETLPPQALARIHQLVKAVTAELQDSVSPALAAELHHLIDGCEAQPSASEVRIEYASLLGWLGGLVTGMYTQLQDSKRDLLRAGRLRGGGPGDPDSRPAAGVVASEAGK